MKSLKRIFAVALLVLFNFILFAQNETISTNVIKQRLDSIIVIGGDQKIDYFYDNSGYHTTSVTYQWSDTAMEYEQSFKNEFTYNLKGICDINQQYKWDNTSSQWLLDHKSELGYDENDQILSTSLFIWTQALNSWELETKIDYRNAYNSINQLESITRFSSVMALDTILISKFVYAYNLNETLQYVMRYDKDPSALKLAEKDEYVYDGEGNLTSTSCSAYHNGRWYLRGKEDFTYNTLIAVNQLLIPNDYMTSRLMLPAGYLPGCMITSQTHTFGSLIWTKLYYYSPIDVTAINDQEVLKTRVFPNPATDYLNIHWNGNQPDLNVELFDGNGRKVLSGRIANNSKLPIQAYPEGMYLVKISEGNTTLKTEKVYFY